MSAPVLIMAGGTGGHVFPGLAVADALRAHAVPVTWLGARGGMEEDLVQRHQLPFEAIEVQRLRGKGLLRWMAAPFQIVRAVSQALRVLRRLRPRSVLALGGFAAGPGGLAAWLMRVPLVVHEQNRIPGLTNKVLMRLAKRRLCGLDGPFARRVGATAVGNPVREQILNTPAPVERGLAGDGKRRLLILGGSQGARFLNQNLPKALAMIEPQRRPSVLHQCGARNLQATVEAYADAGVTADVQEFIADMAASYCNAELAVCRSGALTVAELAAVGLPSLLVPFPFAVDDHQTANAQWLVDANAAELMPEDQTQVPDLAKRIDALLNNPEKLQAMAVAARALAPLGAAQKVAETCMEVAR